MPELSSLIGFSLIAFGMVLTPGPNMIYVISRSISQGRRAGMVSLAGVATGFLFYMLCAAFGITGLLMAVPFAYDTLRFAGALYLLYLAWQAVKPGGRSLFQLKDLPPDSNRQLFLMGLMTNLLNPKVAVMYLSLLPQFMTVHDGASLLSQSLVLGFCQIAVSLTVNSLLIFAAGSVAVFLTQRPSWAMVQRWFMGTVLCGFAVRMMVEGRK